MPGELRDQPGVVDSAPDRGARAQVGMIPGGAGEIHGLDDQGLLGVLGGQLNDLPLMLGVLVAHENPAGAVVHRRRRREVPTASNGFIAATSRKPAAAGTPPSRGTWSSPSDMTVSSTLSVSSGTRLSSSTYNSAPPRRGRAGRRRRPPAGSRRTRHAPGRRTRPAVQVSSALPSTSRTRRAGCATSRSRVDLPVPGGPSSRTWAPARAPRAELHLALAAHDVSSHGQELGSLVSSVLVDDDAAHVLAGEQVVVALVDLVQGVRPGDDLVELEVAGLVQPEDLRGCRWSGCSRRTGCP